jgi:hypothetical protein
MDVVAQALLHMAKYKIPLAKSLRSMPRRKLEALTRIFLREVERCENCLLSEEERDQIEKKLKSRDKKREAWWSALWDTPYFPRWWEIEYWKLFLPKYRERRDELREKNLVFERASADLRQYEELVEWHVILEKYRGDLDLQRYIKRVRKGLENIDRELLGRENGDHLKMVRDGLGKKMA